MLLLFLLGGWGWWFGSTLSSFQESWGEVRRVMMGMWVWPSGMYMADTAWATCSLQNLLMTEDLQA